MGVAVSIGAQRQAVEASDLDPGEEVTVRILSEEVTLESSEVPTFASGRKETSTRHDAALGETRLEELVDDAE